MTRLPSPPRRLPLCGRTLCSAGLESRPLRAACLGALLVVAFPKVAAAQLHADVEAEAGVAHRFATNGTGDRAGETRRFGPIVQVAGDLALLPLVRAGVWFAWDANNQGGANRDWVSTIAGGIRARGIVPVMLGPFRPSITTGVGWAVGYGHRDGRTGGSLEIPVAVNLAYKLRKPYELTFGLGTRISVYNTGERFEGTAAEQARGATPGRDFLLPFLTVGIHAEL